MLTSQAKSGILTLALFGQSPFGGIAQLARARGSYPRCPRFKSRCRYHAADVLQHGPLVKWLRHRPFTAVTRVRVSYGSPTPYGERHQGQTWRHSSAGRALASHARGHRFEFCCLHQQKTPEIEDFRCFLHGVNAPQGGDWRHLGLPLGRGGRGLNGGRTGGRGGCTTGGKRTGGHMTGGKITGGRTAGRQPLGGHTTGGPAPGGGKVGGNSWGGIAAIPHALICGGMLAVITPSYQIRMVSPGPNRDASGVLTRTLCRASRSSTSRRPHCTSITTACMIMLGTSYGYMIGYVGRGRLETEPEAAGPAHILPSSPMWVEKQAAGRPFGSGTEKQPCKKKTAPVRGRWSDRRTPYAWRSTWRRRGRSRSCAVQRRGSARRPLPEFEMPRPDRGGSRPQRYA